MSRIEKLLSDRSNTEVWIEETRQVLMLADENPLCAVWPHSWERNLQIEGQILLKILLNQLLCSKSKEIEWHCQVCRSTFKTRRWITGHAKFTNYLSINLFWIFARYFMILLHKLENLRRIFENKFSWTSTNSPIFGEFS